MKGTAEDEALLDQEQHKQHRRLVGKIQWLAYTRPDISYGAKGQARSLQAPTQLDNKKLEHMIGYLKGTRYTRHNLRPKIQAQDKRVPLNIDAHTHTDANGASCETTRKSTTGFVLYFFGAAVHYGSRSQATIALSSAEPELCAIGAAAQERLYISNFIKEAFEVRTNIRTHTDSSAAKSVATREGASKKAKRIEPRHPFTQQLVKSKIITVHKVKSEDNAADLLTKFVGRDTLNKHLCNVGL